MASMSIKNSLLIAVSFLLITLTAVSVLTRYRLNELGKTIEMVGRERLPRIRALGEVKLAVTRIRMASVRMAIAESDEQRAAIEKLALNIGTELDAILAKESRESAGDSEQAQQFNQIVRKWNAYLKQHAAIISVDNARFKGTVESSSSNDDSVAHLINVASAEPFEEVIDSIDDAIASAERHADQSIEAAKTDSAKFSSLLWSVNLISFIIGLGALIYVLREVSMPIRELTASMELIAKGHLDTNIPFTRRTNELGMMARALTVFRQGLIENLRLSLETRTLSALSDWLQSAKSETELYTMIAQVIQKLLPDCKGSLYIYANSRDILEGAKSWNGNQVVVTMHPDDCWGLRRGRTYVHGMEEIEFRCTHVDESVSDHYCCIPILAHGETVGLLHLEYLPSADESRADASATFSQRRRLGLASAEHISLAIANVKLRDQLRDQSVRDVLTGLYNRRYMLEAARRELQRAARANSHVSILSIDVDHFKTFNDNHGHDAGDTVLRNVGECLRMFCTGDDIACRFGGEEFVILLPNTVVDDAIARAEDLRGKIEALTVRYAEANLPRVTISIGIAGFPASGSSFMEVLNVADAALYTAKHNGRNRVEMSRGTDQTSLVATDIIDAETLADQAMLAAEHNSELPISTKKPSRRRTRA